jgi:hypothetical protein
MNGDKQNLQRKKMSVFILCTEIRSTNHSRSNQKCVLLIPSCELLSMFYLFSFEYVTYKIKTMKSEIYIH